MAHRNGQETWTFALARVTSSQKLHSTRFLEAEVIVMIAVQILQPYLANKHHLFGTAAFGATAT